MRMKKIFSLLLCLALTLTLLPCAALAEDAPTEDGIVLKKTATYNKEDKSFTITLEAYATGEKIISTETKEVPTDIILVLDLSSSMDQEIVEGDTTTRLQALEAACKIFAEAVAAKEVNHRIAIVGFNGKGYLYIGSNAGSNDYANAFQDMSTDGGKNNITASINALSTGTGTVPAAGLTIANSIFAANPITEGETRNRVVILFTDGYPSTSGPNNFSKSLANDAITQATTLKDTYKATVYSVAVIDGADPESAGSKDGTDPDKVNWYLHNVSSNNGILPADKTKSYYLVADNAEKLKDIFQTISSQVEEGGSFSELDGKAVVRDIISPYFTLPEGATKDSITLKTYKYNGPNNAWTENPDAMGATANINGDKVNVTGFNFSENWCGTENNTGTVGNVTYRGNKLVISFKVQPKAEFLGGNDVVTNGDMSGIYATGAEGEEPLKKFELPKVNVPINDVAVTAVEKNVYLLGSVTAEQLKSGATINCGNVTLDLAKQNYGLQKWQNEYVNITVEVRDSGGNVVSDLTNLTDDTAYTVYAKVAPKTINPVSTEGEKAIAEEGSGEASVNVFKPELTFKDSYAYYGETAPAESSAYGANKVGTDEWQHEGTYSSAVTMLGVKPALDITYTPDETKLDSEGKYTKLDLPVKAAVKIGEEDVTGYTEFVHKACDPVCGWTDPTDKGDPAFLIHIKTCQLTVTKTGGTEGEPYVFDVFKDGAKSAYTQVTVVAGENGEGSEVIYELPVGSYTIKEADKWSWRYEDTTVLPVVPGGEILSSSKTTGAITCENEYKEDHWLNGYSSVVKNIYGVTGGAK